MPLLDQAALVEHQHLVGVLDGRQAVRDHQRGAVGHQVIERVLHQALGLGVERGGGLVEDQDRRVLEHRARDRQALALAARQPAALAADAALQAFGQALDEFHRVGAAHRAVQILPVDRLLQFAVGDVGRDRAVEQHHLLADQRDLAAQVGQPVVLQRMAVEQDLRRPRCRRSAGSA